MSLILHMNTLLKVPVMFKNKKPVRRDFPRAVVIGFDDSNASSIFYAVDTRSGNIQQHFDPVFARQQSETRDFADHFLIADTISNRVVGLKSA